MLIVQAPARRRQLGLGLVELMVGITVGLIVAAGASMVAVNQINEHRRLMLETQIQQDLRTAADLLQQDLRRAGFRGLKAAGEAGVWAPAKAVGTLTEQGPQAPRANAYGTLKITAPEGGDVVAEYLYARTDPQTLAYNTTGTPWPNEYFGYRWDRAKGVLYLQLGFDSTGQPNWQPITDPDSVSIIEFELDPVTRSIPLRDFCEQECGTKDTPACPTQEIREIRFKIVGRAKHDQNNVVRTLTGIERVRADVISGACPT